MLCIPLSVSVHIKDKKQFSNNYILVASDRLQQLEGPACSTIAQCIGCLPLRRNTLVGYTAAPTGYKT